MLEAGSQVVGTAHHLRYHNQDPPDQLGSSYLTVLRHRRKRRQPVARSGIAQKQRHVCLIVSAGRWRAVPARTSPRTRTGGHSEKKFVLSGFRSVRSLPSVSKCYIVQVDSTL